MIIIYQFTRLAYVSFQRVYTVVSGVFAHPVPIHICTFFAGRYEGAKRCCVLQKLYHVYP